MFVFFERCAQDKIKRCCLLMLALVWQQTGADQRKNY